MIPANTSGEASKYGVQPDEAPAFVQAIARRDRLRIAGLMTIGKLGGSSDETAPCFARLCRLRARLHDAGMGDGPGLALSMGTSNDFETAIAHGADLIRVGSQVFGPRPLPDRYYWPD